VAVWPSGNGVAHFNKAIDYIEPG